MSIHDASDFDPVSYLRIRIEGKRRNHKILKAIAIIALVAIGCFAIGCLIGAVIK